jgi:hypothetical protein
MSYVEKFNQEINLELDDATELAVKVVMREGELRFRDALIASLQKDIDDYLSEVDGKPNMEWIEGVRYVIHILREANLDAG